ncbi:MAG TPA: hypothetical protein VMR51_02120 [Patescibacteria group bacterium]|nr:hypothetical protein [Patescibacteria group bacterium]
MSNVAPKESGPTDSTLGKNKSFIERKYDMYRNWAIGTTVGAIVLMLAGTDKIASPLNPQKVNTLNQEKISLQSNLSSERTKVLKLVNTGMILSGATLREWQQTLDQQVGQYSKDSATTESQVQMIDGAIANEENHNILAALYFLIPGLGAGALAGAFGGKAYNYAAEKEALRQQIFGEE